MADTILIPKDTPDWQQILSDVESARNTSQTARDEAKTQADISEIFASTSAGGSDIYSSISNGLSNTSEGDYFAVRDNSTLEVYENDSSGSGYTQISKFELRAYIESDGSILEVRDSNGNLAFELLSDGTISIKDAYISQQERTVVGAIQDLESLFSVIGDNNNLIELQDVDGNTFGFLNRDGIFKVSDVFSGKANKTLSNTAKLSEQNKGDIFEIEDDYLRTVNPDVYDTIRRKWYSGLDVDIESLRSDIRRANYVEPFDRHEEEVENASSSTYDGLGSPNWVRVGDYEWLLIYNGIKGGQGDFDPKDLVYRRVSYDEANDSFSIGSRQILVEEGQSYFGLSSKTFPIIFPGSAVKLQKGANSGRIIVTFSAVDSNREYGALGLIYSDDNGYTWSTPQDILRNVYPQVDPTNNNSDWTSTNPNSQSLVELRRGGPNEGRLVQAFWHKDQDDTAPFGVEMVYSDDQGSTWNQGLSVDVSGTPEASDLNETSMAQARNGDLVAIIRTDGGNTLSGRYHYLVRTPDGETISEQRGEPSAQSSETRTWLLQANNWPAIDGVENKPKLMFLSIQERGDTPDLGRADMRIFLSYDNGENFDIQKRIKRRDAGYCAIETMPEHRFIIAYEDSGRKFINLRSISLSDIYSIQ